MYSFFFDLLIFFYFSVRIIKVLNIIVFISARERERESDRRREETREGVSGALANGKKMAQG